MDTPAPRSVGGEGTSRTDLLGDGRLSSDKDTVKSVEKGSSFQPMVLETPDITFFFFGHMAFGILVP